MRAQSWYQQQGEREMKCDHRRDTQGHCVFDCNYSPNNLLDPVTPKSELPCVSFIPARAAYHEIKEGSLIKRDPSQNSHYVNPEVLITAVYGQEEVQLGVSSGTIGWAGRWNKKGLKNLGEALLKLSEYMED